MTFEWDEDKAAANVAKHGIRFDYAARVFDDPYRLEREDRSMDYDEPRYQALGSVGETSSLSRLPIAGRPYGLFQPGEQHGMSDGNITKFRLDPANPPTLSVEELARLDAMTDEEIEAAARTDPDAQPLTKDELRQLQRVPNPKAIREQLHLTQQQFAETFGLSLGTVRDWEQGRFEPDQAAKTLLKVIAWNPEAVKQALESNNYHR